MNQTYHRILSIAGSDSGGGAGIQADLKAISACGGYGMTAITALTAQNTQGVQGIHAAPPAFLKQQIQSIIEDIGVDAIKIGMLHDVPVIEVVAEMFDDLDQKPVVIDPVMVATSGDRLLEPEAVLTLRNVLLPQATLITPNIPEAEILSGLAITNQETLHEVSQNLALMLGVPVLLKGGHLNLEDGMVDVLSYPNQADPLTLVYPKVDTNNTHGTGCTLSSAIATYLGKGFSLEEAVRQGRAYLQESLEQGAKYKLGQGAGPVHHFYAFWQ